ncbi:MAG TPA: ATP-binding protein [Micromonosporaceae bacterium]|nr:ATP-binding protein [Micromonosporaceae bacterium]
MIEKPAYVFDRDREWRALAAFSADDRPLATLGVVSGRRRQGKTYLLNALVESVGGVYFGATEATEEDSLRLFGAALGAQRGSAAPLRLDSWSSAVDALFALAADRPLTVVIDEFPYLLKASPGLASLVQRELDPPAQARHGSQIRLLLCGSAMSVMGKLLSGTAPLRGRASLEIVLSPLTYRDAARFWGVTDPRLAVLLHSVVGGTPAYRRQFVRDDAPASLDDFDDWVTRTVLDPTTPLFREARYLLAEEADIRDPALYHSVLAAVATGNATWGGIASYIGRRTPDIAHPVAVLENAGLLTREPDALRPGRPRYSITEPLITFYEAVMRASWSRLELGLGRRVWQESAQRFTSQVVGPHFERLCRTFATTADPAVFGDVPGEVASGTVTDPTAREQIEVDVVVFAPTEPGAPRRVLSLGEAKWGRQLGLRHLRRLARARELLGARGFDTRDTRLACYGGGGFDNELLAASAGDPTVLPIDLDQLYAE